MDEHAFYMNWWFLSYFLKSNIHIWSLLPQTPTTIIGGCFFYTTKSILQRSAYLYWKCSWSTLERWSGTGIQAYNRYKVSRKIQHPIPNLSLLVARLNTLLAESEDPTRVVPSEDPARKIKRLTDFEKGKIALLYEQGKGYGQIANNIGRPKSTVQNFIQRYIERGTHENKPHPGRKKKISKSMEEAILDLVEGNASISKLKLIGSIPELQDIHPWTMDRMLWGKGIRKWIARK